MTPQQDKAQPAVIERDIVILGGGIAGLWLMNRLQQTAYSCLLLDKQPLGSGQTLASQGIIHGGTKYALTGKLTHSSQAIAKMPARWRAALEGSGEVDLSGVKPLSEHQYLFSTQGLGSKMAGFFASKVMSSRMQKLAQQALPPLFQQPGFKGSVYQLDEPVLNTQEVIAELARHVARQAFQLPEQYRLSQQGEHTLIELNGITIKAQRVILCAGEGNETLLKQLRRDEPKMQRRPLQMPMLKSQRLPMTFAHALGPSALPRMTITSAKLGDEVVWYLGGEIAEQGVGKSQKEQIAAAKKELSTLLPWCDVSDTSWSTLTIDRAEPLMADGSRPAESFVHDERGVISAWPVKLAMAPLMSDRVIAALETQNLEPISVPDTHKERTVRLLKAADLKSAEVGLFPWQNCEWQ